MKDEGKRPRARRVPSFPFRLPPSSFWSTGVARTNLEREEMRRCVLCGKTREQVSKLILGLHGGICVECVDLCNDVIRGEEPPGYDGFGESLPKPKDIYK